jgi:hypothetical protein
MVVRRMREGGWSVQMACERVRTTLGGFQDRGGLTMRRTDAVVTRIEESKKFGQMMQLLFTHIVLPDPGLLRALSTLR